MEEENRKAVVEKVEKNLTHNESLGEEEDGPGKPKRKPVKPMLDGDRLRYDTPPPKKDEMPEVLRKMTEISRGERGAAGRENSR